MKTIKGSWSRVHNTEEYRANYDEIFAKPKIDLAFVCHVEVDGVDTKDHPDYCDAYISSAVYRTPEEFRYLTEKELDWLNEQSDYVHEQVMKWIH